MSASWNGVITELFSFQLLQHQIGGSVFRDHVSGVSFCHHLQLPEQGESRFTQSFPHPFTKLTASANLPQVDVTSYQGVLFSLCMVLLLCAITISIVVPFGYVSLPLQSKIDVINDITDHRRRISLVHLACCYPS